MTNAQVMPPPSQTRTRWEYKLLEPKKWEQTESLLNVLGGVGWECVGVAAGQFGPKLILKREVS